MKKGFNILLILCAALVAISCSKTKSYTDMLKDEKEAIERLKMCIRDSLVVVR